MGWTKLQLVTEAFNELILQGDEFDITPGEQAIALRRLDAMLALWDAKGIRIGYALPSSPDDSDIDADSGIPDSAVQAVYANLAIKLAPSFGKTVSLDTRTAAREGYELLMRAAAMPQEQQLPHTMPRGAGAKPWRITTTPFMPRPDGSPMQQTPGGDLDILE